MDDIIQMVMLEEELESLVGSINNFTGTGEGDAGAARGADEGENGEKEMAKGNECTSACTSGKF